jgi:hypothetical protein
MLAVDDRWFRVRRFPTWLWWLFGALGIVNVLDGGTWHVLLGASQVLWSAAMLMLSRRSGIAVGHDGIRLRQDGLGETQWRWSEVTGVGRIGADVEIRLVRGDARRVGGIRDVDGFLESVEQELPAR